MAVGGRDEPTQKARSHACSVSQVAMLFDCRKVMVDAGQPGELPLMRELSAANMKTPPSLKDTTLISPAISLLFVASPAKAPRPEPGEPLYPQHKLMPEISSKRGVSKGVRLSTRAAPLWRPESRNCCDATSNWDLGIAEESARGHEEPLSRPRQSISSKSDAFQNKPTISGRSHGLLHNIRPNVNTENSLVGLSQKQRGMQRHRASLDSSSRRGSSVNSRAVYDVETETVAQRHILSEQTERARLRNQAIQKGSALKQRQEHPQVLSPLALNSADDMNNHGHSLSLFSLEGSHDHYEKPTREMKVWASNTESPQDVKHMIKQRSWRPQQQTLLSSASTRSASQRTASQGSSVAGREGCGNASNQQSGDVLEVSELPKNGCGLPCYWSKSQKRGRSLLDTAGRSLSCGLYSDSLRRGEFGSSARGELPAYPSHEPIPPLDLEEAMPLLSDLSVASDELEGSSTDDTVRGRPSSDLNGELGLNGRIASVKAQQRVTLDKEDKGSDGKELAVFVEGPRSLSQKYRPRSFDELVGQNLVAHALSNAVRRGRVAPVYLFQGSRGTGKTSAARIFAAALNCSASNEVQKPCGVCKDCLLLGSGKSLDVREVDAASNNGVEKVKCLLKEACSTPSFSQYKVFIVDECHILSNETWTALLKLLEEPPGNFVFILITTDPDKLPSTAVSRCQKFVFLKISETDITTRLQSLAKLESLDVVQGALELIASRSDGSLRDAETVLDQLSLLGHKITLTLVHELVGSVSDEKLLNLLDFALCSDTVHTVQRARELIDSGVEPLDLMAQLATLITDILAGSNEMVNKQQGSFFSKHALSGEELERLRLALQILSESEKQLRAATSDRTTWLTAALLQFGPARQYVVSLSSSGTSATGSPLSHKSSGRHILGSISVRRKSNQKSMLKGMSSTLQNPSFRSRLLPRSPSTGAAEEPPELQSQCARPIVVPHFHKGLEKQATFLGPGNLGNIWLTALESCKSMPLRQFLQNHGKLLAVSIAAAEAVIYLELDNMEQKLQAESFQKSIANAFQSALGVSAEVRISLPSLPAGSDMTGSRLCPLENATLQMDFNKQKYTSGLAPTQKNVEASAPHYGRRESGMASPSLEELANSDYCFSAVSHPVVGITDLRPTNRSPTHLSTFEDGNMSRTDTSLHNEARIDIAWIDEAKGGSQHHGKGLQEIVVMHEPHVAAGGLYHGDKTHMNPRSFSIEEEESLRLESQSKYGGMLCWKAQSTSDDEKMDQGNHQRRCGVLLRLVPCAKTKA